MIDNFFKRHNNLPKPYEENNTTKKKKEHVLNLLLHGKIETTEARAKEVRKFVDKMISSSRTTKNKRG